MRFTNKNNTPPAPTGKVFTETNENIATHEFFLKRFYQLVF